MAQNSMAKRAWRGQVDGVVEDHDAAMADHALLGGEGLVVQRRVEQRRREIGAQRPADLHRAQRPAAGRAAAEIVDRARASVRPKAFSTSPPCLILPASWKGSVPRERPMPIVAIELGTLGQDDRHAGQGDDVVDDGRLAEQALDRRQRRLEADDAALAFEALQQRGLFAADIGAGAQAELDVEGLAAARDIARRASRPRARSRRRAPSGGRRADIRSGYRRSPRSRRRRCRRWSCPRSGRRDRLP